MIARLAIPSLTFRLEDSALAWLDAGRFAVADYFAPLRRELPFQRLT